MCTYVSAWSRDFRAYFFCCFQRSEKDSSPNPKGVSHRLTSLGVL